MNVADVEVFNKVAATLSFTDTAQLLGLSRSAVSKRIARLEADTGVVLFRRSPRCITLTAAGERLYTQTMQLDETLRLARDALRGVNDTPFGKLKVTVPTAVGASLLPPLMQDFRPKWPQIELDINMDDRYLDIVGEGYDVAIRIAKRLGDSSLVSRRLATTPDVLLASPRYLERFRRPQSIRELQDHQCLVLAKRDTTWRFSTDQGLARVRLNNVTTFNNELAMILAACMDGGIVRVPQVLAESDIRLGRLVPVLQRHCSKRTYKVFAIYPDRRVPASVRVFIDFVEQWLPRMAELDRWNPLPGLPVAGDATAESAHR